MYTASSEKSYEHTYEHLYLIRYLGGRMGDVMLSTSRTGISQAGFARCAVQSSQHIIHRHHRHPEANQSANTRGQRRFRALRVPAQYSAPDAAERMGKLNLLIPLDGTSDSSASAARGSVVGMRADAQRLARGRRGRSRDLTADARLIAPRPVARRSFRGNEQRRCLWTRRSLS